MKQLLIFGNRYQQDDASTVLSLLSHLRERGMEVAVEQDYLRFLSQGREVDAAAFQVNNVPPADMALSLGGDGTFLTTVMWVARQGMPILGINVGHLGYLTAGRLAEGNDVIDDVLDGNYRIEERTMLEVSCDGARIEHPWALNEIAVLRHDRRGSYPGAHHVMPGAGAHLPALVDDAPACRS